MEDGLQNKKVGFIIQARMKSTRLPGKILLPMPIGSRFSLLEQIISNLKSSKMNASIYIATSLNPENEVLENVAVANKIHCFRGSENDVLSRFISIIENENFDTVVRLTADNPIIDIEILDRIILQHMGSQTDYTNTSGLPLGMNFEVFSADALLSLKNKNLSDEDKEHVTLYLKNSNEYICQTSIIELLGNYRDIRVTVDYPSDYLVVSSLFSLHLETKIPLGIDIVKYAKEKFSFLFECNELNVQKGNYKTLEEEIDVAVSFLDRLEFKKTVALLQTRKQQ